MIEQLILHRSICNSFELEMIKYFDLLVFLKSMRKKLLERVFLKKNNFYWNLNEHNARINVRDLTIVWTILD